MSRPALSFVGVGLLAGGCSAFAPQAALNPKYKTPGSAPGPARVLPILECRHTEPGKPNPRQRELFLAAMPGELWRAAGLTGEPVLAAVPEHAPLCEEFNRYDAHNHGYTMNARVQHAVDEALAGRPEQSLLVTTFYFPYRCEERTSTVSDAQGTAVGTVGTGKVDCRETGGVQINTLLLTRTEVVWFESRFEGENYNYDYSGTYANAPKLATELFGAGFPHEVVAPGTTVEPPATATERPPTAKPAPAKATTRKRVSRRP